MIAVSRSLNRGSDRAAVPDHRSENPWTKVASWVDSKPSLGTEGHADAEKCEEEDEREETCRWGTVALVCAGENDEHQDERANELQIRQTDVTSQ